MREQDSYLALRATDPSESIRSGMTVTNDFAKVCRTQQSSSNPFVLLGLTADRSEGFNEAKATRNIRLQFLPGQHLLSPVT